MTSASALRRQWSQLFAPADRTLPAMLTHQAERFAQKPLVTAAGTTWTYADACDAAARCAGTLRSTLLGGARLLGRSRRARNRASGFGALACARDARDARELPRGNRYFRAGIDLVAYVSFEPGQTKAFDNILPLPLARE
jgi:hypothetical protein